MLYILQRRCGLSSLGEGDHVDLPLGWSELAILAQCKGKLQDGEKAVLGVLLDFLVLLLMSFHNLISEQIFVNFFKLFSSKNFLRCIVQLKKGVLV